MKKIFNVKIALKNCDTIKCQIDNYCKNLLLLSGINDSIHFMIGSSQRNIELDNCMTESCRLKIETFNDTRNNRCID